jgi:TonB-dependent starch-binding outer membrane protein SusC
MRRPHRTLACLSLLATAACTADSVAGPQAVPAPKVQAKAARPADLPGAPQRGPKQVRITGLAREPLFIVDGVMQREDPRHLTGAEIAHIQVLRGDAAAAAYGGQWTHGVVLITTRAATSSAP